MMRLGLSLALGLVGSSLVAQGLLLHHDPRVDLNAGYKNTVGLFGLIDYNANTVANELPLALYQGGEISRSLRQQVADGLQAEANTAGYILEGGLRWTGAACWGTRGQWRPMVQVAYRDFSGLSFTQDQYLLTFFGNALFAGRSARLSPSGYERMSYRTIGAGVVHDGNGSNLRVELVQGGSFTALDVRSSELFTAADGRVLRTSVLGEYLASDTAKTGFGRTNGLGAALSGRWAWAFEGSWPLRLSVGVEDLGFIAWNSNSVAIRKDTLVNFEGWYVENLFALDKVLVDQDAVLDTLGLRFQHGQVTRPTPFQVHVNADMPFGADWRIGLALDHRYLTGYAPHATLQVSRVLGTRTLLATFLSYGGFGGARIGLGAKHRFGRHVLVTLSTPQVPAFFDRRVRGMGMLLGAEIGF